MEAVSMMKRLVISIDEMQMAALEARAKSEYRTPWQEAAFIIRQELTWLGLLEIPDANPVIDPPACDHAGDEIKL
jgi:hypothetical protein